MALGYISHGGLMVKYLTVKFLGSNKNEHDPDPNTVNFYMWIEISKPDGKRNLMKMSGKLFYLYYVVYLHRICNELWMKLLSLTQNPVCVSNITQENEASVNKNTCLSFLFQLHASKDKAD